MISLPGRYKEIVKTIQPVFQPAFDSSSDKVYDIALSLLGMELTKEQYGFTTQPYGSISDSMAEEEGND